MHFIRPRRSPKNFWTPCSHNNPQQLRLKYLNQGGLPGICFTREQKTRDRKLQDILSTILDRDLRLVYETNLPFNEIFGFTRYLAFNSDDPFNISDASRKTKLASKTIKGLISAFQNIFLLREIPIEGTGSKGSLYFFEDQYEERFLSNNKLSREHQIIGAIYRNLRAQFEYQLGATPEYFQYRTRGGAMMPLCIRTDQGILGVLHREKATPLERTEKASIDSFLKTYLGSKVLVLTTHKQLTVISDQILIAPISLAL